jgi:hypothetical protein
MWIAIAAVVVVALALFCGWFIGKTREAAKSVARDLARTIDTKPQEQAAIDTENAAAEKRATEVLRASSPDLAARVDELRSIGRGEKPPDSGAGE